MADEHGTALGPSDIVKPYLGVPPPLVAPVLVGAGVGMHVAVPVRLLPSGWVPFAAGLPVIALGFLLAGAALRTLHRANTDDWFARPTSAIVQHGPYRLSRNPMYLSLAVILVAIALAVNTGWLLAVLPVLIRWLQLGVIRREERYLARRFGDGYPALPVPRPLLDLTVAHHTVTLRG